jgi:hypothetical protein
VPPGILLATVTWSCQSPLSRKTGGVSLAARAEIVTKKIVARRIVATPKDRNVVGFIFLWSEE